MEKQIEKILGVYVPANSIESIDLSDKELTILVRVQPDKIGDIELKRHEIEENLYQLPNVEKVRLIFTAHKIAPNMPGTKSGQQEMRRPPVQENLKPEGVKNIICVASGKGGVGKSTLAANLAVALTKMGLKTGLLDADIYGPSVPKLFGLEGQRASLSEKEDKKVIPMESQGVKLMSIGFLVDADTPMIWRGPMVQSAIRQFFQDVEWGKLDVLIVDMPPGTGDAQLTLSQKVPLKGAVIISTPQDIALIDAIKGIEMFDKVNIPVLGLVENMAHYECPKCGHEEDIFGAGEVKAEAKKRKVPFLGAIPLNKNVRINSDEGQFEENHYFKDIAKQIKKKL